MKISKIEKKKRLYLLELDNQEKLYVTEDTIVRFMLSKGMIISDKDFEAIKAFAQFSHGKNLALYFISYQVRTKKQVTDYLKKHEIDQSIITKIIKELEKDKWIDDDNYIESFLKQNELTGDNGPHLLKQKLMQKGISARQLDQQLSNFDFYPIAQKLAQKCLKKYQAKLPSKALRDKVTQSILNKGFSYDTAKRIVENLQFETEKEQLDYLLVKELDKQHRKFSKKYQGYELRQKLFQSLYRKGFDSDAINESLRDYL
ncbi:recombination regulator RecX [Streptococcus catagoni]|uniref:recombination regulator RecX n=1 Tax=Streptococcus catagoni TaxID=2654874 RepID=UPI00140BD978|nr:recombination regulator RecX [Streptococcus catagoni]